jgi:hypothetical protein
MTEAVAVAVAVTVTVAVVSFERRIPTHSSF